MCSVWTELIVFYKVKVVSRKMPALEWTSWSGAGLNGGWRVVKEASAEGIAEGGQWGGFSSCVAGKQAHEGKLG